MLIVPGDSWFFAKLLTGRRLFVISDGTARSPKEALWLRGSGTPTGGRRTRNNIN